MFVFRVHVHSMFVFVSRTCFSCSCSRFRFVFVFVVCIPCSCLCSVRVHESWVFVSEFVFVFDFVFRVFRFRFPCPCSCPRLCFHVVFVFVQWHVVSEFRNKCPASSYTCATVCSLSVIYSAILWTCGADMLLNCFVFVSREYSSTEEGVKGLQKRSHHPIRRKSKRNHLCFHACGMRLDWIQSVDLYASVVCRPTENVTWHRHIEFTDYVWIGGLLNKRRYRPSDGATEIIAS